jgi:hypothetical protein
MVEALGRLTDLRINCRARQPVLPRRTPELPIGR